MSYWYLQPLFESYLLVGVLVLGLIALLLVPPTFQQLSWRRKQVLILLRGLAILLIALAMLRPTWVRSVKRPQSAVLAILFDTSRSMTVPDAQGGSSRWDAQTAALRNLESELSGLGDNIDVLVYGFGEDAVEVPFEDGALVLPEEPTGRLTDIGSSLSTVMRQNIGKRLAGVVLLSDGAQRVYAPRIELQQAARDLARLGSPLHTVTFGRAIDPTQARDVAVETLADHFTVFIDNEMRIKTALKIQGYANLPIEVQLEIESSDGTSEVVDTQTITANRPDDTLDLTFDYTPEEVGQFKLRVNVPPQDGELVTRNNQLVADLNVLPGGLKVLYVEGRVPDRPEQKFLRRAIAGSADMQLDFQWIDRRRRDAWPVDLTEQLRDRDYDVIIIGDLDSDALSEPTMTLLAERIESGKGFIMLGGFNTYGPGGYQTTPLADVLPVQIGRLERQDLDAPIREDLHLRGPLKLAPATSHFLTNLGTAEDGSSVWNALPPMAGANRFSGIKPRAQTILRGEGNVPLLVAGEYGLGRTLAFAADSTWQWVMDDQAEAHRRFWRQTILWLAKKEDLQRDGVWVRLPQRRFFPEANVEFTAGASLLGGETIQDATYQVELVSPDGTRQTVRTIPTEEGVQGTLKAGEAVGDYVIEVTATKDGESIGTGRGQFFVFDQDLELADPSARPSQMASLSAITSEAGGRTWVAEELSQLIEQIKSQPPETETEVQVKWVWPEAQNDAWACLVLLVTALGSEWYLRKRWNLV
ncbi:MAG: glutamine amidotransferase [Pirellulaceae bacterium]